MKRAGHARDAAGSGHAPETARGEHRQRRPESGPERSPEVTRAYPAAFWSQASRGLLLLPGTAHEIEEC